ncbi:atrial natriuretic peptide-converting enzyme isoform X2 [Cimex lectularius]|uniref:Atrial natriuretic peptide-converting enzyme n=1 Tax=Cimex lectularius TaxID=79782 RepID=A0A8I6RJC2_CIMLE|nr:atrial natriuretic peptide-converting enzyme isoform X2 [Cimex lectularius]
MPAVSSMERNNNGKRKASWDSKISVSSVKSKPYLRSDTPSSILSSDSDIRFTRKLGRPYRCSCYIITGFIVFLLLLCLSLYLTYTYLSETKGSERVYLGVFRVSKGESFNSALADPHSELFRLTSREYRELINLCFRRSVLRPAFLYSDVLAFDGENEDLIIHFTLHFNTRKIDVAPESILQILKNEMVFFGNRTIDHSSVKIQKFQLEAEQTHSTAISQAELVTTRPVIVPSRQCSPTELSYCQLFVGNETSYPNLVGHQNLQEVIADVIKFRELVDSECYRLAQQFICHLLQPPCSQELVLPCRRFCKEFWSGCGARLSPELQKLLNCSNFPEYSAERTACLSKPGCVNDLEYKGMSSRLCDGVPDCPDLSDETSCSHCEAGSLHCSTSKACIHSYLLCNGKKDCPDGSDERFCLTLAPTLKSFGKLNSVQAKHYHTSGNVVFTEKGQHGKVCVHNLNSSVPVTELNSTLDTIASSLCKSLTYRNVAEVKIEIDHEEGAQYVKMENPTASEIQFIPTHCASKEILSVQCSQLECGLSPLRDKKGIDGLGKMAAIGDWPWHIALFKAGIHICDGTLIEMTWVITTASCFQGQEKAEWIARAGSTRLSSTSPWQQERHVIGMIKSPVEGSTIVLLKLDRKLVPSDFVRPICLPPNGRAIQDLQHCNTLGWAKERTMLQRVGLKLSNMDQCANISITTVNSVCTDSYYSTEDCNEEELAGSPMSCLHPDGYRWVLAGVSNWRIACSKVGDRRPRLYDQTIPNIEWIKSIIFSSSSLKQFQYTF